MAFEDLYQEIILDHYRNPRNYEPLEDDGLVTEHENPVCGDRLKLLVQLDEENRIQKLVFDGSGCAISMSSASMMTEAITGKTKEEAKKIVEDFLAVMRGEKEASFLEKYGDLVALAGVVKFPVRIKCATLAWHALEEGLEEKSSQQKNPHG